MNGDNIVMGTISPKTACELIKTRGDDDDFVILDIRPKDEFDDSHISGALNLDYDGHDFQIKVNKLDKEKSYLIYCRSGVRGGYFLQKMKESGFKEAYNILGGFVGWQLSKFPLVNNQ